MRAAAVAARDKLDDPDQNFYENYVCGAEGNYIKYCNPELDKLVDRQSMEANQDKRKALVWEIERKLAEDGVRPIIFYAPGGNCRRKLSSSVATVPPAGPIVACVASPSAGGGSAYPPLLSAMRPGA